MKRILLFLAIILASMISCSEDETVYSINPSLQKYVDTFYLEAEKKGFVFDRSNLIVEIKSGINVHGRTIKKYGAFSNHQIIVQIQERFLTYASDNCIEALMFHELGHALLHRDHNTDFSYMNDHYKAICPVSENRAKLINEMFTPHK